MPTEPFAMDYEYLIDSDDSFIQDGIDSLNKLFDCPIYINSKPDSKFLKLDNVIHNTFNKLHNSTCGIGGMACFFQAKAFLFFDSCP